MIALFKMRVAKKKECGSPGKDCDGISETLRWFN